jgi:cardiolipin synthase
VSVTHLNSVIYYGIIIFGQILSASAIIHMLYVRRTPASMIAWLLSIAVFPYIAVPLYFIIGTRKHINKKGSMKMTSIKNKQCQSDSIISEILSANGIPKAVSGNNVSIYTDGIAAYNIFLDSIKNAKESIYISTYIFEYDRVTKKIIDLLAEKSKSGVDVKILLDSVGSYKFYFRKRHMKRLVDAGVEISFFMPILRMPFKNYINLRNHRKIYIFDKKRLLSGGMNISNNYMGTLRHPPKWNDLMFKLKGYALLYYLNVFESDWNYASGQNLNISKDIEINNDGQNCIQVTPSGPDIERDGLFEALAAAIHAANERIWIVTPYFVPDVVLMRALIIAKHRGVDVKLITPKKSNHIIADLGRSSYMRELEDEGVCVALYKGSMLHAKAVLFDDTSVMLGSVNFDNRSLFLNYEVASFSYSKDTVKDAEFWIENLLENSDCHMKKATKVRLLMENLMRVFAPQL